MLSTASLMIDVSVQGSAAHVNTRARLQWARAKADAHEPPRARTTSSGVTLARDVPAASRASLAARSPPTQAAGTLTTAPPTWHTLQAPELVGNGMKFLPTPPGPYTVGNNGVSGSGSGSVE